jgi:hypothetical protein
MNIKITSYIYLTIIIIIFTLVGFLTYDVYFQPVQEGLETRIKREDGKLVKRRKKKSIHREKINTREGLWDPFEKIRDFFEKIKEKFEDLGRFFKKMGKFLKSIGDAFLYVFLSTRPFTLFILLSIIYI